ncbi:hypothetical protein HZA75_04765 [Candidatus Roizmanbacteria bacterium]|nr:hypothetical protein [Candidatus Roizmanbacteria bacterium]
MIINAIVFTLLILLLFGFMMLFAAYSFYVLTGGTSFKSFLNIIIHPIAAFKRNTNSIINTVKWLVYLLIFFLIIGFIGDNWNYITSVFIAAGQIIGAILLFIFLFFLLAFIVAQFIKLVIYYLHEK